MFKTQSQDHQIKEAETIIGPSVKVKGDFHGQGNIIIEGMVSGSLKTSNALEIGDQAKVAADIEAKEAKIGGEVKGNLKIKGYLEVTATAKIFGDVEASLLSVARGAIINGKCTMVAEGKEQLAIKEDKKN